MHYRLQNLVWLLREAVSAECRGNIVAEILSASGSGLATRDFEDVDCSYRICKKMLDPTHLRTMFVVRSDLFEKLEALMIEIYRHYGRSRHGETLLFHPKGSTVPISAIGRGRDYVFAHVVREHKPEPGAAPNGGPAEPQGRPRASGGPPSVS